jgi:hypothetical protein
VVFLFDAKSFHFVTKMSMSIAFPLLYFGCMFIYG